MAWHQDIYFSEWQSQLYPKSAFSSWDYGSLEPIILIHFIINVYRGAGVLYSDQSLTIEDKIHGLK